MTQVTLDKEVAEDLVNTKLRIITEDINEILQKWNYTSVQLFLDDARSSKLRYAEDDAIVLRNLLDEKEELYKIKKEWQI